MGYKDNELSFEELKEVTDGIKKGKTDEMLNKLSISELEQFKGVISKERKLSIEELDNVKAGIPQEMVEEVKKTNENIFK